jgi:hypothetical protein
MEDQTMNLTPILIGIIIASSVIIGMYTYYDDVNTTFQPSGGATSSEKFSGFNSVIIKVNNLTSSISNRTADISAKGLVSINGVWDSIVISYDVVGFMLQSPIIITLFINQAVSSIPGLGGNGWFTGMITAVVLISIVGLCAAIVLKRFQSEI